MTISHPCTYNVIKVIKGGNIMRCVTKTELEIINRFRLLWEQHSEWTRMAITAIVFELPNEEETVTRLLRNPKDFAMTLRIFYGERVANQFSELLTEHLVIAAELVKAVMAGNTVEVEALERRWYQNAEDIAKFLGKINPCWSVQEWRKMLFEHLRLVKDEAVTLINGNYQLNVEVYDILELQALEMADMMSEGIIKQFIR